MYIKPSKKIQQHHTALLLTTNIINKLIVELLFRKSVVVCVVDGVVVGVRSWGWFGGFFANQGDFNRSVW